MRRSLWLVVVAAGLLYPLVLLAGGAPSFPSPDDCARPAAEGQAVEAVFGRFDTEAEASELLEKAVRAGFIGAELQADSCGHVKVVQLDIPDLAVAREFAREARSVGLDVALEQSG